MISLLVLGYGNPLRGDDGAGSCAAEEIGARALPGVQVRALHQLLPELADPIAAAECVIFIDAAVDVAPNQDMCVQEVRVTAGDTVRHTHGGTPAGLLALARDLYGAHPRALLISIAAENFSFGAPLSERTQRGLRQALQFAAFRPPSPP